MSLPCVLHFVSRLMIQTIIFRNQPRSGWQCQTEGDADTQHEGGQHQGGEGRSEGVRQQPGQ